MAHEQTLHAAAQAAGNSERGQLAWQVGSPRVIVTDRQKIPRGVPMTRIY
jgi:hypothetical protein